MSSLKYCPECGAQLDEDALFCNTCGADLRTRKKPDVNPQVQEPEVREKQAPQPVRTSQNYQTQQQYPQIPAPQPGYEYATFGPRFLAWLVDIIIVGIVNLLISAALPLGIGQFWQFSMYSQLIGFVLYTLYFWGLEAFNNGQTLGKMALRLRTVDEESLELADTGQYLVNNLFRSGFLFILDIIVGLLINSGDPQQKLRLAQNLSRTVVLRKNV